MTLMAGQDTIERVTGGAAKTSGISSTFLGLLGAERLAGSSVLDVGTGWGRLALELAPRCRRVVGIDREVALIEDARRRAAAAGVANAEVVVADAEAGEYHAFNPTWSSPTCACRTRSSSGLAGCWRPGAPSASWRSRLSSGARRGDARASPTMSRGLVPCSTPAGSRWNTSRSSARRDSTPPWRPRWPRWWDWRTSGGVTAAGSGTSSTWRRAGERSRVAIRSSRRAGDDADHPRVDRRRPRPPARPPLRSLRRAPRTHRPTPTPPSAP